MKVRDLLELVKGNLDAEVIIQKDSEGNGYSPLAGVDAACVYVPENSYSGTVYSTNWTAQEAGMEKSEWKQMLKQPRCVVLYPAN